MFILTFAVIGLSVFFYIRGMKTTLLFLSILISISSLGQKRVKDIMKLSMGDSIGVFDNSGLTMDDKLEILMENSVSKLFAINPVNV